MNYLVLSCIAATALSYIVGSAVAAPRGDLYPEPNGIFGESREISHEFLKFTEEMDRKCPGSSGCPVQEERNVVDWRCPGIPPRCQHQSGFRNEDLGREEENYQKNLPVEEDRGHRLPENYKRPNVTKGKCPGSPGCQNEMREVTKENLGREEENYQSPAEEDRGHRLPENYKRPNVTKGKCPGSPGCQNEMREVTNEDLGREVENYQITVEEGRQQYLPKDYKRPNVTKGKCPGSPGCQNEMREVTKEDLRSGFYTIPGTWYGIGRAEEFLKGKKQNKEKEEKGDTHPPWWNVPIASSFDTDKRLI